jgi:hypothetical protein
MGNGNNYLRKYAVNGVRTIVMVGPPGSGKTLLARSLPSILPPPSDEEALYIKQVTEEKVADPVIHSTVLAHSDDLIYLEGAYRGQVNGEIKTAYSKRGLYEELSDVKYTDTGGIFDIMAVTVIESHLVAV